MRVTRLVYLLIATANVALNVLALLDHFGNYRISSGIVPAALFFNLLIVPVGIYAAYRLGEIAEEHFRRDETVRAEVARRANQSTIAAKSPPRQPANDGNA
jgi:hypothetical protein